MYCSYSQYSQYLGHQYCSYSKTYYSEYLGRQYSNTLSTRSTKNTRCSEYTGSIQYTRSICASIAFLTDGASQPLHQPLHRLFYGIPDTVYGIFQCEPFLRYTLFQCEPLCRYMQYFNMNRFYGIQYFSVNRFYGMYALFQCEPFLRYTVLVFQCKPRPWDLPPIKAYTFFLAYRFWVLHRAHQVKSLKKMAGAAPCTPSTLLSYRTIPCIESSLYNA